MYIFDKIFLNLVNMSVSACWLVLAVILFRLIFKKAPKWINCCLWALVAIRLVYPFSIESILSLVPSKEIISEESFYYSATPSVYSGIEMLNSTVNPIISDTLAPEPSASVNPAQILGFVCGVVWLVGLSLMLVYTFVSYLRLKKKVSAAILLKENQWICDEIDSPFILGVIRPRIYLPSGLSEEILNHVIAHEKAHLKRRDHFWKPLGFLLLSVYWFNPILWLAYIMLCRDIELACDEKVIKESGTEIKKAYSQALVSCSTPRKMITACPVAFGEVSVKQRIKSVLNYKKPAFWVIVVAVIASIVVAVCFMTDPKEKDVENLSIYEIDEVEFPMSDIITNGETFTVINEDNDYYDTFFGNGLGEVRELLNRATLNVLSDETVDHRDEIQHDAIIKIKSATDEDVFVKFHGAYSKVYIQKGNGNNLRISKDYSVTNPEIVKGFFENEVYRTAAFVWVHDNKRSTYGYGEIHLYVEDKYEITSFEASNGTANEIVFEEPKPEMNGIKWKPNVEKEEKETNILIHSLCENEKVDFNITMMKVGVKDSATFYYISAEDTVIGGFGNNYEYLFDKAEIDISKYVDGNTLTKNKIPNTSDWKTEGLKSAGLEGVIIDEGQNFAFGKLYMLYNNYPSENYSQKFLAVETKDNIFLIYVGESYEEDLLLCDVDGESGEEIVLNQLVGAAGGAGAYVSSVYKVTENGISVLYYVTPEKEILNGFDSQLEAPFLLKITNNSVGYETVIDYKDEKGYIGAVFDEAGNPIDASGFTEAMFDSFYDFSPIDTDGDGVYEIECMQYASLYGHTDYIGSARSILKYDKESGDFKVISAEFIAENTYNETHGAYWSFNPYAGGSWWYVTQYILPEGYEIKSAEATNGTITVDDRVYNAPEGGKCVKWLPDFYVDAATPAETDVVIMAVKDGKDVEFKLKITEVYDDNYKSDIAFKTYKVTPLNCKMREDYVATFYLEEN